MPVPLMRRARKAWRVFRNPVRDDDGFIHAARTYLDIDLNLRLSSVVMPPVSWAARTFLEAPLQVLQRTPDGFEPLETHPVLDLMDAPTPHSSHADWWMAAVTDWLIRGNGYAIKDRDRAGTVRWLWYAPAECMEVIGADGRFLGDSIAYRYSPPYRPAIAYTAEDVVHFRHGIDPAHPRCGLSPLASILREAVTDREAAEFTYYVLRNLGVPGMVLTPKEKVEISDADLNKTRKQVMQSFSGPRRGEPVIMRSQTEVKQYETKLAGMDLAAIRNISEERVCAALGIPASVIGFGTGLQQTKVGATMREQRRQAWEDCMIPMQRAMAVQLWRQLMPDFAGDPENYRLAFDRSGIEALREGRSEAAKRVVVLVKGGIVTPNEARMEIGMDAIEGGDELAASAVPGVSAAASAPKALGAKALKRPTRLQRDAIAMIDRVYAGLWPPFARQVGAILDELGELVERAARDILGPKQLAATVEEEQLVLAIMDRVERYLERDPPQVALLRAAEQQYIQTAAAMYREIGILLGVEIGMPDPVEVEIMAEGGRRAGLIDLDRQARDSLFRELADARAHSEGPATIIERLEDRIPAGPWRSASYRAEIIARTEVKHAQRMSTTRAYRDSGIVTGLLVYDARLGPTDEECEERAGRTVTFREGDRMMAEEHPNGTLDFGPVVA